MMDVVAEVVVVAAAAAVVVVALDADASPAARRRVLSLPPASVGAGTSSTHIGPLK
jgi:membrane protein CcdC involved in cytochrome C biogenesis